MITKHAKRIHSFPTEFVATEISFLDYTFGQIKPLVAEEDCHADQKCLVDEEL